MAGHVAAKILAHMEAHEPTIRLTIDGIGRIDHRAWRRHFAIAAQVASLAFSTREDILRETAAAIERGDFMQCPSLETGEDCEP